MAIVISPSTLWSALNCPFKFYNSIYSADPRNTISWALINAAAAAAVSWTNNKLTPRIRYFDNRINPKIEKRKQLNTDMLKKWMWNVYKYIKQYITDDYQIWQEMKLEYSFDYEPIEDDVWIQWQPDIIIIYNNPNREEWIVAEIIDLKSWKISWYDKPDIRRENAQWRTYSWLVFNHWWLEFSQTWIDKPKIKFSFVVADKWTWELWVFSKVLDENTVTLQIKERVKEFREMQKKWLDKKDYPAIKCRWCAFCELSDICPLNKSEVSVSNDELEELF